MREGIDRKRSAEEEIGERQNGKGRGGRGEEAGDREGRTERRQEGRGKGKGRDETGIGVN